MTGISNKDYVTINKKCCTPDGFVSWFFVGGQRTLSYRDEKGVGCYLTYIYTAFERMQGWDSTICELHILRSNSGVSETEPSKEDGPNVWARLKFSGGTLSKWVFVADNSCYNDCLRVCAQNIETVYEKMFEQSCCYNFGSSCFFRLYDAVSLGSGSYFT